MANFSSRWTEKHSMVYGTKHVLQLKQRIPILSTCNLTAAETVMSTRRAMRTFAESWQYLTQWTNTHVPLKLCSFRLCSSSNPGKKEAQTAGNNFTMALAYALIEAPDLKGQFYCLALPKACFMLLSFYKCMQTFWP